jgi:hypothetical protein
MAQRQNTCAVPREGSPLRHDHMPALGCEFGPSDPGCRLSLPGPVRDDGHGQVTIVCPQCNQAVRITYPRATGAPTTWSERYKRNQVRLLSGDSEQVRSVVEELSDRLQNQSITAGERRMLVRAQTMFDTPPP